MREGTGVKEGVREDAIQCRSLYCGSDELGDII